MYCLIVQFLRISFVFSINLFSEVLTKPNLVEPKVLEIVKFMRYTEI